MKRLLLLAILFGTNIAANAQDKKAATDPNDQKYTRIIDGVLTTEKYSEAAYDVKLLTEKEELKLKLHYHKHVMLINTKDYPVEDYIFVAHRDKYISHSVPAYVKLPIVINGKLLSQSERKAVLPTIDANKIKRITYLNHASAHKYTNAPFGVVEILL